jgi:hypothetical protein
MKYIAFIFSLGLLMPSFQSCKKNRPESITFDYEKAAGIWVPYEIINGDGSIVNGPFFASSVFGVYAESVQLNKDKTFIPVAWQSKTNFILKSTEKGTYVHQPLNQKIIFDGIFHMESQIIKFYNDELWLDFGGAIYKYKKQL